MRRLLFILSLFLSAVAFGQQDIPANYVWYKYTYGTRIDRGWFDKVIHVPRDTIFSKSGIAIIGNSLYYGDSTKWYPATGTGSSGGLTGGNVGTGFRLYVPSLQAVKTMLNGYAIGIDSSSTANTLTFKADTSLLSTKLNVNALLQSYATQNALEDTAADLRAKIAEGGGGDTSLIQITRKGNYTDTAIHAAGSINYETYGVVWEDKFQRAAIGSNYVNSAAGSTITFPSSAYMNLAGDVGSASFTNLLARTDTTNENKGAITARVVINTKSATSYGFAIGWGNLNTLCCDHHVYGGVTLTTSTNNIFFAAESGNFIYTDAQALTIASGDTIDLTLSQSDWTYTLTYFNHTTDVTRTFTLTGVPQGSVLPFAQSGFSRPVFVHLGGSMRVYNWSRISNESKYARNVFITNSIGRGGNITDPSQGYAYVATGNQANTIISGGGGSVSLYSNSTWTADLSRYAAGGAENFWFMMGGNDSLFSVWLPEGKDAAMQLRNRIVASGKRFIWMTPMPRDAIDLSSVADTIIAIATRNGDPYADAFHRFEVGTDLPAPLDAGDGTHLTAIGNRLLGYYLDSLFPQYTRQSSTTGLVQGFKGQFQKLSLTGRYEWNYTTSPLTATIPNDASYITINPSSTISVFTIQLPYVVDTGHFCIIHFGGTMTSGVVVAGLTLNPPTGQTISKMPYVEPLLGVTTIPFGVGDEIIVHYLGGGRWEAGTHRTGYYTDLYANGHKIGRGALVTEQTNLALGIGTLNSVSLTGTGLTAVGQAALATNTSGVRNTAVGSLAMQLNTTGSNNTAIGEEALRNGNGNNRSAFGYAALNGASGTNNTAMGVNAGFNISTGTYNTIYGSDAGFGITTGHQNLILGDQLGSFAAAQTGTVVIGSNGLRRLWVNSSGRLTFGGNGGVTNTDTTNADFYVKLPAGTAGTAAEGNVSGTLTSTIKAGAKEYNNAHYQASNALNRYGLGGVIFSNSSTVANSTTTVTTLSTYTTKANTLAATEETLYFEYSGTYDVDNIGTNMVLSFGGNTICTYTFSTSGGPYPWSLSGKIVRTGASTATVHVKNTQLAGGCELVKLTGLTFSGTNILLLTGEDLDGDTDAIVKELAEIKWRPAAAN